jgi:hypothetical protein
VHGNVNAANLARALGPVAPAPRPACRSTSSAAPARSPRRCSIMSPSPARQQPPDPVGLHRQPLRRIVRPAGRRGRLRGRRRASRPVGPLRSRSDRRRRPRLRHPGALPTSGSYNVDEAFAELAAALAPRHALLPPPRADRRRALFRLFDDRARPPPSRPESTGSRSRTCCSAAAGRRLPGAEHRRIVRHPVALRPGDRRSLLGGRRGHPAAVRANCIAAGRPGQRILRPANAQLPVITGGNSALDPETRKAGGSARSGGRASCPRCRSRPIISTSRSTARSRRSTPRCCSAAARKPATR